jgi:hypothetical protein
MIRGVIIVLVVLLLYDCLSKKQYCPCCGRSTEECRREHSMIAKPDNSFKKSGRHKCVQLLLPSTQEVSSL